MLSEMTSMEVTEWQAYRKIKAERQQQEKQERDREAKQRAMVEDLRRRHGRTR